MAKRWILVIDKYDGITKNAVNMLSGYLSELISYVLPVRFINQISKAELEESNIIAVGNCKTHAILSDLKQKGLICVPSESEGYAIFVGKTTDDEENQTIAIAGYDESGLLYGCMHFISEYCNDIIYKQKYIWNEICYKNQLENSLPEWKVSSYPAIKTRAIWTWGFVIWDYRAFFDNMARLRLNEVVIWNDHVPFNTKDVVEYAHSLGIKVVWGFAWGWALSCTQVLEQLNDETGLKKLKESVLATYESQYANSGCDGIYFQSFTEMNTDMVNGKCVAEIVTEVVNDIAGELFNRYPSLHIQFGLHATSVKTHLDMMQKVDKRIHIVWEDCGAFPYDYYADAIDGFDETYDFTDKLLELRGNDERFGAVYKGMLKLNWRKFEHHKGAFILGERTRKFMRERQIEKDKIWKIVRGNWLRNSEYLRKTVELTAKKGSKECILQALVEDSMLENKIALPVAIYAQTLWNPFMKTEEIIEMASKNPFVENE